MPKHTPKELCATARQQADRLIAGFGLDLARKIIQQMKEYTEAKATDLGKKYGR